MEIKCRELSSFAQTFSGGTPSRDHAEYYRGNICWVTTGELNDRYIFDTNEHITPLALKISSAKLFPAGTILMAMYGATIGKLGILQIEAATNQACCAIIPDKTVLCKFLYYWLLFDRKRIIEKGCGAGQPNISQNIVKKLQIFCPSLSEQKAIAEALSDIDHLIAATEKLIAKKKDIKKGLMQELLTGKRRVITGATEKVKASELGEIPVDWDVLKISDVFRFITNNTHSRSAMNSNGGKYRNIHYGDILTKYNEIVDCASDEIPFLNADIAVRENALLHTGDVVIADTAEDEAVGKVVEILNADKFAICSGLHTVALRPQERMFAHGFLGYFMNSEIFHSSLLPYVTGIKVSSISKTTIKNAFVLCPPLNEQTIIASALRDVDKDINAQIMKLSKLQMLKSGMMSELLTGRIRLNAKQEEVKHGR